MTVTTLPRAVTLSRPVSRSTDIAPADALSLKRALNRLGHYVPDPSIGLTSFSDDGLFKAIAAFQSSLGLPSTGQIAPGDLTLASVNAMIAGQPLGAAYRWQTVGDEKVRPTHAARHGLVFRWEAPLPDGHPGEAANCRCWAVPVAARPAPPCITEPWWEKAREHIKRFEMWIEHPYLDSEGVLTIGYGFNVHDRRMFEALDLRTPDKNGRTATRAEKAEAYAAMMAQRAEIQKIPPPADHDKSKRWNPFQMFKAGYYKSMTAVRMQVPTGEAVLADLMHRTHGEIKRNFPEFPCFPTDAKIALFDMKYNLGDAKFADAKWPKLFAAVLAQDWERAAMEAERSGIQPGRNKDTIDRLRKAATSKPPAQQPPF